MILKKQLPLLLIIFVTMFSSLFTIHGSAKAVSGTGYFTGLSTCTTNASFSACAATPSTSENDVISGRTTSNGFDAVTAAARASKAGFYAWVVSQLATSQPARDRQGGAFIINTMVRAGTGGGNPAKDPTPSAAMLAEFQQRLYSSAVTMSVVSGDPNNYGNGRISFSGRTTSGGRDVFFTAYTASVRQLLVFRQNGVVVYVLEIPCANPVGGLPGFANPSATITPTANVDTPTQANCTSACVAKVGQTVYFTNTIDTANTANTGADSFDWAITSVGASPLSGAGATASGTNIQLDPNRAGAMHSNNWAFTPATPGTYCRRTVVGGYPAYAVLPVGNTATACVTVTAVVVANGAVITPTATVDTPSQSGCTSGCTAVPGDVITFHNNVSTSSLTNVAATDNFVWTISSPKATLVPAPANGTALISPVSATKVAAASANRSYTVLASDANTQICRTISASQGNVAYPTFGAADTACVTIGALPPTPVVGEYEAIATSTGDHEVGDTTDRQINQSISVSAYPCDASKAEGAIVDVIKWTDDGTANKYTLNVLNKCSGVNPSYTSGTASTNTNYTAASLDTAALGSINRTTTINSVTGSGSCGSSCTATATIVVYQIPYARFYGNDMLARNGGITFNEYPGDDSKASGSQYAAIASDLLANIKLNSAAYRTSSPARPTGLSSQWANIATDMSNPADVVLANLPKTITDTNAPSPWPASGVVYYDIDGDAHISGLVGTGAKITVHAGNIYIDNNVTVGAIPSPFNNDTAPVILLAADQNIFINSAVTRIDAILVTPGTIHTCNNNGNITPPYSASVPARSAWDTSCQNKLTVNGALAASDIIFARTNGTRLKGTANEDNGSAGSGLMSRAGIDKTSAAEVVNFPTYLYFATPNLYDASKASYESLFNAPPQL